MRWNTLPGAPDHHAGDVAYLETDKPENVSFYQRFGFEVTEEAQVLGIPNWFMLRRPR